MNDKHRQEWRKGTREEDNNINRNIQDPLKQDYIAIDYHNLIFMLFFATIISKFIFNAQTFFNLSLKIYSYSLVEIEHDAFLLCIIKTMKRGKQIELIKSQGLLPNQHGLCCS